MIHINDAKTILLVTTLDNKDVRINTDLTSIRCQSVRLVSDRHRSYCFCYLGPYSTWECIALSVLKNIIHTVKTGVKWTPLLTSSGYPFMATYHLYQHRMCQYDECSQRVVQRALTHKHLEMHGCDLVSTVATDAAKAPGHQHPQCWLNIYCTGLIPCRNVTTKDSRITFWKKTWPSGSRVINTGVYLTLFLRVWLQQVCQSRVLIRPPQMPGSKPKKPDEASYGKEFHFPFVDEDMLHCYDVTMGEMASQINGLTIVYSTVHYSSPDQRKHQSFASVAFVRRIHRWPVNSPYKWPVTRKMIWWRHHDKYKYKPIPSVWHCHAPCIWHSIGDGETV